MVSIKIHEGNKMYAGHYYYYELDYTTVTWWECDDDNILKFSGYPDNIYDELSHEDIYQYKKVLMKG